jgi:hypothetical protein
MIKTDVPNFYRSQPGVVIHVDDQAKNSYISQKRVMSEREQMKAQINTLSEEVIMLKELVQKLINKE